jgi:hypothetical protein
MIRDEIKDKLAIRNGLGKERYGDRVREDVRKEMSADDELAILRKAVAILFEVVNTLHHDEISHPEFIAYNQRVEEIKKKHEVLKG